MTSLNERSFHLLMGGLFVGSCFLDHLLRSALPAWNPPDASLITMAIGMIWIGRYAAWRQEISEERSRVIDDRIERLQKRTDALEDELREHLRRPI